MAIGTINAPPPPTLLVGRAALLARRPCPPVRGALAARALAEAQVRETLTTASAAPLCVAGVFDRAAIMLLALASARLEPARGSSLTWPALVGSALRLAWARAKAARRATAA